jgi:hypothetical protein
MSVTLQSANLPVGKTCVGQSTPHLFSYEKRSSFFWSQLFITKKKGFMTLALGELEQSLVVHQDRTSHTCR